jgi:hypothetical protein
MLFTGLAEGLHGRRIAIYVVPAAWAAAVAVFGNHGPTWPVVVTVLWIPIVMAVECLENPDAAPVPERLITFATVSLGAAATSLVFNGGNFYFLGSTMMVAGWMSLAAGLLLPDHSPVHALKRLLVAALACALAAGVTEYYAIDAEMKHFVLSRFPTSWILWPSTYAVLTGAMAAAGLAYGWLAHNRFGASRPASLLARGMPMLVVIAMNIAREADLWPGLRGLPVLSLRAYAPLRVAFQAQFLAGLIVAIAVLVFLDLSRRHAPHRS